MNSSDVSLLRSYFRIGELRRRFLLTVGLWLLFRLLAQIPVLNVDEAELHRLLANNPLLGVVDLLAGGEVLNTFSIAAAGVLPYLAALAFVRVAARIVPPLRQLHERGNQERLDFIAKVMTFPLALLLAWMVSHYLAQQTGLFPDGVRLFTPDTFWLTMRVIATVTAGSLASAWVTDQISKRGIGAGPGVILLTGSGLSFFQQVKDVTQSAATTSVLVQRLGVIGGIGLGVVLTSILLVRTVRRIPVHTARASRHTAGFQNHLPLLLNVGRIVPVTAATGLLALAGLLASLLDAYVGVAAAGVAQALRTLASPETAGYWIALSGLVVLFTYTCNFSLLWRPIGNEGPTLAENLKRAGTFIEGIRPGRETNAYLTRIMHRVTPLAALLLVALAAGLPYFVSRLTGQDVLVTVLALFVFAQTLDQVRLTMEADVAIRSYDTLLRPGKLRQ